MVEPISCLEGKSTSEGFLAMPQRHDVVGVEVRLLSFLTSAIYGGELLTLRSGRFTHEKEPCYPLHRRLGGLQRWYGRYGEAKNILPLPGFKPWAFRSLAL